MPPVGGGYPPKLLLATYANLPVGSTVMKVAYPSENGEPGTGVRAPVAGSIEYPETLPELVTT